MEFKPSTPTAFLYRLPAEILIAVGTATYFYESLLRFSGDQPHIDKEGKISIDIVAKGFPG